MENHGKFLNYWLHQFISVQMRVSRLDHIYKGNDMNLKDMIIEAASGLC